MQQGVDFQLTPPPLAHDRELVDFIASLDEAINCL